MNNSSGSATYVEGQAAVAVDPGVSVSDSSPTLTGAMVQITGNFVPGGEDILGFLVNGVFAATYNQNGISSGVFNTTTGVLTLTGTASLAVTGPLWRRSPTRTPAPTRRC